jgi:thioesterase domain-containing protein
LSPLVEICHGSIHRVPFYCVHGGDGNVSYFDKLANRLGDDQPFFGLRARGLERGLPPHETIEATAEAYLTAIRAERPNGPYLLAGYSAGGVIAFEMAQQLRRAGNDVPLLVLLDSLTPISVRQPISLFARLRTARKWSLRFTVDLPRTIVHRAQLRAQFEELERRRAKNQVVPDRLFTVRVLASYLRAEAKYVPQPYDGPVVIIRASDESTAYLHAGTRLGWDRIVRGVIEVHRVKATHFGIMQPPAVDEVASVISGRLKATASV